MSQLSLLSDPVQVGFDAARKRFQAMAGGLIREPDDLLAAVALSTQPAADERSPDPTVAAAHVRLEGFGFKLLFDPDRRVQVLKHTASRLGGLGHPVSSVADRLAAMWETVQQQQARHRSAADGLLARIQGMLPAGKALLPHQADALRLISDRDFRVLVHDDQGLGKTVEILCALLLRSLDHEVFPLFVASPASITGVWEGHSAQWLSALRPNVVPLAEFQAGQSPDGLVVVGSYTRMAQRCQDLVQVGFRTVVFDESHYLASRGSGRARVATLVRGDAQNVILATGTMQPNGRPIECLASFRLIAPDSPHLQTRKYVRRWCGGRTVQVGKRRITDDRGSTYPVEFGRLVDKWSFRRTKAELGDQLPDKIRYKIPVRMSARDRLELARIRDQVRERIERRVEEVLQTAGPGERGARLAQARAQAVQGSQAISEMQRIRVQTGLAKVDPAVQRVEDLLADGHRVVLFAEFNQVHDKLWSALRAKFGDQVMGGTSSLSGPARTALVTEANAVARALVLTYAYCEGVTLTAFDTVLFVDRHWVPDKERQAEDRVHRIGQTRTTYAEYLHMEGTTDDAMSDVHWAKEGRSSQSVGSAALRVYEWLAGRLEGS